MEYTKFTLIPAFAASSIGVDSALAIAIKNFWLSGFNSHIYFTFILTPSCCTVVLVQRLNEVGENIRNYRKEKKLTQKELGNMCVFSEAMIKQYELGIRTIYII